MPSQVVPSLVQATYPISVEYSTNHKLSYRNQDFHGGCVTGEHKPELLKGMPNKFHRRRFTTLFAAKAKEKKKSCRCKYDQLSGFQAALPTYLVLSRLKIY